MVVKCQRCIIIMAHMYSFASDGSVLFVWQTRFTKLSKLSIRIPFGRPDEYKLLGTYILAGLSIKKNEVSIECNSEGSPVFEIPMFMGITI